MRLSWAIGFATFVAGATAGLIGCGGEELATESDELQVAEAPAPRVKLDEAPRPRFIRDDQVACRGILPGHACKLEELEGVCMWDSYNSLFFCQVNRPACSSPSRPEPEALCGGRRIGDVCSARGRALCANTWSDKCVCVEQPPHLWVPAAGADVGR